jgi:hypothetical protein
MDTTNSHDVSVVHGLGSISTVHTAQDLERLRKPYGRVARLISEYL